MESNSASITRSHTPHERVPELDVLRFIAATLVVFYHYTYRPAIDGMPSDTAYNGIQSVTRYGYLGVQLFFLISGFVIFWSAEGRTAKQFLKSRFLRLYPIFWVCVVITVAVLTLTGRQPDLINPKVLLANLTMVPGYFHVTFADGVYWTLAIELKFYLMVLAAILTRQMVRIELWIYAWLAGLICSIVFVSVPVLKSLTMLPHGLFFVGGAISYLIRSRGLTWVRGTALFICMLVSIQQAILGRLDFTSEPQPASPQMVALIIVLCYTALFAVATKAIRLPAPKTMSMLGALTYPLYLLHNMIGKVLFMSLEPYLGNWGRLFIMLFVAYLAAWVLAKWVEPRIRRVFAKLFASDRANASSALV